MYGSNPAAVGSSHYDCTVEALSYDQTVCQPYSWVTAMVTYRANDGWVFKEKYESEMKSVGIIYDRKSEDTLVVTYTAWVGADGLEVRPTQAMKDYAKLHAGDTANGGAPVATGKRNDLIVDRWEAVTDPATINLYAAQVWKYPTMASGSEKIGRVWEKMRIYDLHAERLFSEVVGQWYLVECSNKIGFVPAAM